MNVHHINCARICFTIHLLFAIRMAFITYKYFYRIIVPLINGKICIQKTQFLQSIHLCTTISRCIHRHCLFKSIEGSNKHAIIGKDHAKIVIVTVS